MTAGTTPSSARVVAVRLLATAALAVAALGSAAALSPSHATGRDAVVRRVTTTDLAPRTAAVTATTNPHGPYTTTSDQCAVCHRAHTAKSTALLTTGSPQSALCDTCHDGSGSTLDVVAQYAKVPANDPATASYWSHDVSKPTSHILATSDEFGGVFNRHTECGDCHDPHQGSLTDSVSSPAGTPWTASGRLAGVSGVAATYSGPGAPTSYTFLDGTTAPVTAEYQLCFKCHSGDTKLLPDDPAHPSRDMTDVATEFNPANVSFHPVLSPGRNTSDAMRLSLSGPSLFKLWSFAVTDTVRCSSCHAAAVTVPSDAPHSATGDPAAGSDLPAHASAYRGILVQRYDDREFKAVGAAFDESQFALCFLCHTDTPFTTATADYTATNFSLHQLHSAQIGASDSGVAGTIDTPGAGTGNALCAECHFRPHSTATDASPNSGLVTFAPDVTGARTWTSTTPGTGSCTLTCHGHDHEGSAYVPTGKP